MTTHEEIYDQIKEDLSQISIPYKYRFLSGILDVIFLITYIIFIRAIIQDLFGLALSLTLLILGFMWLFAQFYVTKGTTILQALWGMKVVFYDGRPLTFHDVHDYMWHKDCAIDGDDCEMKVTINTLKTYQIQEPINVFMVPRKKWVNYTQSERYQKLFHLLNEKNRLRLFLGCNH